jgi:hypothetical protein
LAEREITAVQACLDHTQCSANCQSAGIPSRESDGVRITCLKDQMLHAYLDVQLSPNDHE